jgi:seryl-tRNA synthetase
MEIKILGNQTAQILAGVEPWKTTTVSINLAELTPEQRELVAEGWSPTLVEATTTAVAEALTAEIERRQEKVKEKTQKQEEHDAKVKAWIDNATPQPHPHVQITEGVEIRYARYQIPTVFIYGASPDLYTAAKNREAELIEQAKSLTEQSLAEALAAAEPLIDAAREKREAEEAAEKKAKAEAFAAKKARRAEIEAVEIEIERGNARDWGTPWGAVVTAARGKDQYDFDAADYDLSNEVLTIRCQPGDVIAWGQKNYRKPKQTIHERKRISADWAMVSI